MGRSLLGVVLGVFVAMVVIFLVEMLGLAVYPLPEGANPQDPASLAAAIETMPVGGFLFVLGAWCLGAGLGAFTAMRTTRATGRKPGAFIGALVLVGALYNMWTIPHPAWFMAAAVVGVVAATWIGSRPAGRAEA